MSVNTARVPKPLVCLFQLLRLSVPLYRPSYVVTKIIVFEISPGKWVSPTSGFPYTVMKNLGAWWGLGWLGGGEVFLFKTTFLGLNSCGKSWHGT